MCVLRCALCVVRRGLFVVLLLCVGCCWLVDGSCSLFVVRCLMVVGLFGLFVVCWCLGSWLLIVGCLLLLKMCCLLVCCFGSLNVCDLFFAVVCLLVVSCCCVLFVLCVFCFLLNGGRGLSCFAFGLIRARRVMA